VPTGDGGWIYVSNSEHPPPVDVPGGSELVAQLAATFPNMATTGGAGAIRFAADGSIVDAYPILQGSLSNCAGGLTAWGTWLSCEEWEDTEGYAAGRVWECDPFGEVPAVARPALGIFKHEMATSDPDRQQLYLTEDQPDGLLYRYTPPAGTWGSSTALEGGLLEAMSVDPAGRVTWIRVADFDDPAAPSAPLRTSVVGATPFDGGEGVLYDAGLVYVTTKGDDRVWVHDVEAQTMTVLYDASEHIDPVLSGVDNIAVSAAHDLYVAEDGGNLEVCVITPDRAVFAIARMTGPQHGFANPTPIPLISEVTGLALSPDGNRLYFNSERGMGLGGLPVGPGPGILYEVTGPFRGGTMAGPRQGRPLGLPSGPPGRSGR
jgi:secreted PhoX family phosphatase